MPLKLNHVWVANINQQARGISHLTSRLPLRPLPNSRLHIQPSKPRLLRHATNMTDTTVEAAKRAAAHQAVADHFDPAATHVGIGSGTTIVYVVEAIKERSTNPNILFVPTGYQSPA